MKLIEGMKKLRLIEKKMDQNAVRIGEYASSLSTEKPHFESEDKQRKEVCSLIQANEDLVKEYLKLKLAIERTNLLTEVELEGNTYKISELLAIRRKLAHGMINTLNQLTDAAGRAKLSMYGSRIGSSGEKGPYVVRFYDEKEKNEQLRKWQDLYEAIDIRLETINATTELV
jgi:hypothetical protein